MELCSRYTVCVLGNEALGIECVRELGRRCRVCVRELGSMIRVCVREQGSRLVGHSSNI